MSDRPGEMHFAPLSEKALIESRMRAVCQGICDANGVSCDFLYTHEFTPTVNWKVCTQAAVRAAEAVVGADRVNGDCEPWMASEDFGTFLTKIPGCFVFLGSGAPSSGGDIPLHNARFDYNDDVLLTGAEFFAELVRERLS